MRRFLLCAALSVLTCITVAAGDLGDLTGFVRRADTIELRTSTGALVRIDILGDHLFRLGAGPQGNLEDEGSHKVPIVIQKDFFPATVHCDSTSDNWTIRTKGFALVVSRSPLTFALYSQDQSRVYWKELKPLTFSPDGTIQTLRSDPDEHFFGGGQQNGSFEFKGRIMQVSYGDGWEEGDRPNPAPFYMSSKGYGVLRNTWTDGVYDFWSDDYLTTSHKENRFDAYYMVGGSIHKVLDLYTQLTGRAGLLPRWAFEYGDADCYNDRDNIDKPGTVPPGWSDGPTGTTPDVVSSVAKKYREQDMPAGWILPNDGYGCGYTDLPAVVDSLRKLGFHTGLWTESGMDKIAWEVGTAGTRVQKIDVAWSGKGYQFALDANHDAAQGILDNSDSRPFVWTVMGWAGIQRYAVTWTGDQSGSWDYIRWHIPTLIGSGLSGMIYSTGDVDGIYGGSPETFTRDLQWKCFTPVLMGMSGWSKTERKHPWWFEEPYRSINRQYLKLKMRLMPYMYTLARQAEQTGAPIVRGLMWHYPNDPHAYDNVTKYQFMLGPDLLIAPVYRSQAASGGWRDSVYLPKGKWVDYWDGTVTEVDSNGRFLDYPVTLDKLPIFVRAGAIIPMYPEALYDGQVPKDELTLDIYPCGLSQYTLYEDDGYSRKYREGEFSIQEFSACPIPDVPGGLEITVESVLGEYAETEEQRNYLIQVHTGDCPEYILVDGQQLERLSSAEFAKTTTGWCYSPEDRRGTISVRTGALSYKGPHTIILSSDGGIDCLAGGHYPTKPALDSRISTDKLLVINRPAEEPGYPLEHAFDGNPSTWFRTVRDQSVTYGPHEFVLSLGGRRVIDGFQIAPRNDKWWKYGQVRGYELYLSENNGDWGAPVLADTLRLTDSMQTVRFSPAAGRVLRFRVLSVHNPDADTTTKQSDSLSFDALTPTEVKPITISEFRLLEHYPSGTRTRKVHLSDHQWLTAESSGGSVSKHSSRDETAGAGMRLNGLSFHDGFSCSGNSRIDYHLTGDWQQFRTEAGVDDSYTGSRSVRFQVYGNDRLLYESGIVRPGSIAKIEVDVRGISALSLRTVSSGDDIALRWANPVLHGYEGDAVGQ
jgi:alpha-glucosidase (family GH31 glycosyl hydrolase)